MRALRGLLIVASVVLLPHAAAAQLACGDTVERRAVRLAGDLDCTGYPGPSVVLIRGTLRLNGFTVRGGEGIKCADRCKVVGPGIVEESTHSGIWSNLHAAVRYSIAKVTIRNNALWGIAGFVSASTGQTRISLRDAVVETNGLSGIFGDEKVKVLRSTIRDNGTFNGGAGVSALYGSALVRASTIEGNRGEGIFARDDVRVAKSTIIANELGGIVAGHNCGVPRGATVRSSTITGNATGACGPGECADIASCTTPRVHDTICDTSHQIATGLPGDDWDVCALD